MPAKVRDYKAEYKRYHGTEEQKEKRAKRNAARNKLKKKGKVRKGDGKDVDHIDHNPKNNSRKNLRVQSASKNRSFARNKDSSVKKKSRA